MPPLVYKTLGSNGVSIKPFKVHKTQHYTYTSGSSSDAISLGEGLAFTTASGLFTGSYGTVETKTRTLVDDFISGSASANSDGTFKELLYDSVKNLFYSSHLLTSRSVTFPAGGDGDREWTPSDSIYVLNIAQQAYGETVRPGTFSFGLSGSIYSDDGYGRIKSASVTVGNIFYPYGLCVLDNSLTIESGSSLSI